MNIQVDLAIVGSGFAGSLLALIARRLGLSVVLLERERHPRFAIGESSTPLANLLLEELARRYDLPDLLPFTKWGTWQKQRPEVAAGLKRGFTFYHHRFGEPWQPQSGRGNELLVAASPHDEIADTHWYRADFDQALARMAAGQGVELVEGAKLESFCRLGNDVEIQGRAVTGPLIVRARFVVDASGPRGFLARALDLRERPPGGIPATQSLFTHFRGVARWDALHRSEEKPPYPVDDAAVHHIFDGGWIWVLRFNNGLTSAGVAATDPLANDLRLSDGAVAWDRLLTRLPSVREQFAGAETSLPFRFVPRLAYRAETVVGDGWALLPSAAGFVDPLLSTGFPLTLLGVERLAWLFERDWKTGRWSRGLEAYASATLLELDRTAELIGVLYENMAEFGIFSSLTLLYFAAASFSETVRRLDGNSTGLGFLLGGHPTHGEALQRCVAAGRRSPGLGGGTESLVDLVRRTIEPFNVAGLANAKCRNWYPARAEDLLAAAGKLAVDRSAIEAMLRRTGFSLQQGCLPDSGGWDSVES